MKSTRRSAILESGVITVAGPLIVFSIYLLFAGHNQPGGGFSGGLVAGVLISLVWAAGGTAAVRRVVPLRATLLMGTGLVVAALTGFASLLPGLVFLESGYVEVSLPVFGDVKVVSALFFDIGVYLVVVGMALGLVKALGEEGKPMEAEQ
ncbi:MAG: MnhB domain-containing protein [Acidimicrobiia bacterium]|nr:MnhB domain-containing protein [Acidimicrobiia bacterium]